MSRINTSRLRQSRCNYNNIYKYGLHGLPISYFVFIVHFCRTDYLWYSHSLMIMREPVDWFSNWHINYFKRDIFRKCAWQWSNMKMILSIEPASGILVGFQFISSVLWSAFLWNHNIAFTRILQSHTLHSYATFWEQWDTILCNLHISKHRLHVVCSCVQTEMIKIVFFQIENVGVTNPDKSEN